MKRSRRASAVACDVIRAGAVLPTTRSPSTKQTRIRAALEGLKTMMTSPLAPASRFAPEVLAVGQILKRFDGAYFRIRTLEKEKGIVEIEGVREPYREFRRIEDLRFQFSPPE